MFRTSYDQRHASSTHAWAERLHRGDGPVPGRLRDDPDGGADVGLVAAVRPARADRGPDRRGARGEPRRDQRNRPDPGLRRLHPAHDAAWRPARILQLAARGPRLDADQCRRHLSPPPRDRRARRGRRRRVAERQGQARRVSRRHLVHRERDAEDDRPVLQRTDGPAATSIRGAEARGRSAWTGRQEGDIVTAIIQTEKLTKSYGAHRGVIDIDLEVDEGEAFGFLGPNGAGKTTTIRTLLDHIRPTSGRALVFGIDTTVDPVEIHRRIGYLPGEFTLYDKLTGGQTIDYFANLRGGVDAAYQADLIRRLDIDTSRRFKEYSKGNKQKIGLILALQHRPDLLVLDEPTSGLDPLVQQTFFEVIREAKAEGRTVFLSSHILGEVEKTCDRVAIIREGRLVKVDRVEALRDLAHHQVELRFTGDVPVGAFAALPGVSDVSSEENVLRMRVSGSITPVVREAANYELLDFVSREPSLEETFLAEYGRTAGQAA